MIAKTYLLAQGSRSLKSHIVILDPRYIVTTQSHDRLGWDSFAEGHITILWLEVIWPDLKQWSPCKSIEKWGVGFLNSLLSLTHKQWIFQNFDVHHSIMTHYKWSCHPLDKIRSLMQTHPADLLPCHCHLLNQTSTSLEDHKQYSAKFGLHQWSLPWVLPHRWHWGTLPRAVCLYLIRCRSNHTFADCPLHCNTQYISAQHHPTVPNSKHSQLPFGPQLNQLSLPPRLLLSTQPTWQESITISTGKENRHPWKSRPGQAWLHSPVDMYGQMGHLIAIVQLLCPYGGKERKNIICPDSCKKN